ncbi:MAG: efflux RND transporter periplasmic adaptor subunit [Magnetococcales bacterium]|nr:efflux RND transporter periplasmic adaptor subunit [Magnetococcales bacterium]
MRFVAMIILTWLLSMARPDVGFAHGEVPAMAHPPLVTGLGAGATGERFEVVVVRAPDDKGVVIHLADLESNAPVAGARIEAERSGDPAWKETAAPTPAPGIYALSMPLGKTTDELTLTVTAGQRADLLLVPLSPPAPVVTASADPPPHEPARIATPFWVAGMVLAALIGYLLGRVGRRKLLLLVMALGCLPATQGFAHGGEDHGGQPQAAERALGDEMTLPKATQFVLGVRTLPVAPREAAATARLVGRVIPDPAAYARVHATMTARVGTDPGFPVPVSGQRVTRGQPLAALDPNPASKSPPGRELLHAPIEGVITDAHIVPGEVVTEQTVLAEIVQPDRLWVEAVLFDPSLTERIRGAMAETRLLPGQRFRLRWVGASARLSAEDQGLHLQFAVEENARALRLGMPLDVHVELETVAMPLAVPHEALLEKGGQPVVWVKTAPERFAPRAVFPGRRAGAWTEILTGLRVGDKVVVQGQRQLDAAR